MQPYLILLRVVHVNIFSIVHLYMWQVRMPYLSACNHVTGQPWSMYNQM